MAIIDFPDGDAIINCVNLEPRKCAICDGILDREGSVCGQCKRWSVQVFMQFATIIASISVAFFLFNRGVVEREDKARQAAENERLEYERAIIRVISTDFEINLKVIKEIATTLQEEVYLTSNSTNKQEKPVILPNLRGDQWNLIRSRIPRPILHRTNILFGILQISDYTARFNDTMHARETHKLIGRGFGGYIERLQVYDEFIISYGIEISNAASCQRALKTSHEWAELKIQNQPF